MTKIISIENISKSYRLGQIGTGTLSRDLEIWFAKLRGKSNPLLKIGEIDYGNRAGETIWALKDVSFQVDQGEVLGIIGRNGAGKSTLLKILSRITAPTSGQIKVRGRIASLLEVGTGFHPELTGSENIYLNGAILGMSKEEVRKKFDEIIHFAEVEKFVDTPVKRYSSGMYVRLAFAVAAHLEPEILLVDEVLAVGDVEFQKKCLGKMGDVAKKGRTVLFVSHNMAAVNQLCPKTLLLDAGKLRVIEETGLVIQQYLYTKDATSGYIDLSNHNSRRGNQKVLFQWASLSDSSNNQSDKFSIGETISINFCFKATEIVIGTKIKVAVQIKTSDGIKICHMINTDSNSSISNVNSLETFSVRLPDIRFYPGSYYISLWVGSITSDEVYDHLDDCLSFEIIGGGKLTTRKLPRHQSLLFLTPDWIRRSDKR